MTWTLILIVWGVGLNHPPAVTSDMKFVDEASCRSAAARVLPVVKKATSWTPVVECIQTEGRE
ncbi:hypothetical protein [Bosea massiliensis]|uniref:Secreted protein n=1 Tax=Bosea massiliensis TaxID=151419 RepID=A0ABW0PA93_9HYPH